MRRPIAKEGAVENMNNRFCYGVTLGFIRTMSLRELALDLPVSVTTSSRL